jgi:hypothetical protein
MLKNIFTYWDGPKSEVIEDLEEILEKRCSKESYALHKLTKESIKQYIKFPDAVFDLPHIVDATDFLRVKLLKQYGGIWLDSDVLVRESLDGLFKSIEEKSGFFIGFYVFGKLIGFNNAILGAKDHTDFYKKWEEHNDLMFESNTHIGKSLPFGNSYLNHNARKASPNDFLILDGVGSKIEPFSSLRSRLLLAEEDPLDIVNSNAPLIHFFKKNHAKYDSMEISEKEKTLLYKLIKKTQNENNNSGEHTHD